MSGIFGVFYLDGKPACKDSLRPISDSLKHRGSDGHGYWSRGSTSLGHRMFHTTPEALHENLPYTDTERNLTITCDVRLDNRDELINQLRINMNSRDVITDSLLLLSAYRKWGIDSPGHLLGDFAFAIWDQPHQRLFCARDHLGIKPFAYYSSQEQFIFASEAHAILKAPRVPHIMNEGRIADFLVDLEGIDKSSTFYEQIYRLPPAHMMVISSQAISINCYWHLDQSSEIILKSDEEYVDAFNEIYTDAIKKRLRGNGDVASMLSGGIDSSSIVGIARELHHAKTGDPFPVISAVNEATENCTETHFINAVINQGKLKATTISINNLGEYNQEITNVISSLIEPFDFDTLLTSIYLLARNSGNRVILDGIDGDLITSLPLSYPAYLMRMGHWSIAIREIKGLQDNFYRGEFSSAKIFLTNLRALLIPLFARQLKKEYLKSKLFNLDRTIQGSIISRNFADRIKLPDRIDQYRQHHRMGLYPSLRELHISSIRHPHISAAIERYDRIAAQCGIEPRHPLLDKRLVQFMVSIPWDQKVRNGWNKYLLRNASSNILSEEVCWRRGKEHLGRIWTKNWLALNREEICEIIVSNQKHLERYIDNTKLNKAIRSFSVNGNQDDGIDSLLNPYLLIALSKLT